MKSPKSLSLQKETYETGGIPLTVIPKKETVQAKKIGITKSKRKRGPKNSQQKEMTAYSK